MDVALAADYTAAAEFSVHLPKSMASAPVSHYTATANFSIPLPKCMETAPAADSTAGAQFSHLFVRKVIVRYFVFAFLPFCAGDRDSGRDSWPDGRQLFIQLKCVDLMMDCRRAAPVLNHYFTSYNSEAVLDQNHGYMDH